MVFKAIFDKMGDVKTERELEETVTQINTSLDNILSESTQYFPPFIGCVLVGLSSLLHINFTGYTKFAYAHSSNWKTI